MCGRFTLTKPPDLITQHFGLESEEPEGEGPAAAPRYNIAPRQSLDVVRVEAAGAARALARLSWGLVPPWSRHGATTPAAGPRPIAAAPRPINARAETAAAKPAFRDAMRRRRCLIPADGFYEWQAAGKHRQPWYIHRRDDGLFAFGGLWEGESCAILTTAPNALMAPLHDRMPLIVRPSDYAAWLEPGEPPAEAWLQPYRDDDLEAYPVGSAVGSVAFDQPECRAPVVVVAPPQALLF